MAVRIRLQRHGRKKKPFYHIVVADSRSPRDGKFIEKLGTYNPLTQPADIKIDRDKAFDWLMKGAQPTDTARAILKFKGLYYRKHLQRGVTKGAMTQEQADAKYQEWVDNKEQKIEARKEETRMTMEEHRRKIFGEAPPKPEPVVEEEETPAEDAAETTEDATAENTEVTAENNENTDAEA